LKQILALREEVRATGKYDLIAKGNMYMRGKRDNQRTIWLMHTDTSHHRLIVDLFPEHRHDDEALGTVYPLKRIEYEGKMFWGPADPVAWVQQRYGKNVLTELSFTTENHRRADPLQPKGIRHHKRVFNKTQSCPDSAFLPHPTWLKLPT
jgi:hypothetical protein